ncbi:MAG TPA: monofunctional biosynthetic peptidoglycan transglycosylase, partial [Pseudorhizobium sp.]|nr:monofunctional biosynthetic peptidoglycan transglycosylase [Pseudorhizobium sp.]
MSRRRRTPRRSVLRRLILICLAVLVAPYLLILLYALPVVRPVSTLMLADLALLKGYDRQWVALDDISPNLVQAVMMSEDGQFCRHAWV